MSKVYSSQISVLLGDADDLYHWEHIMNLTLEQIQVDRNELLKVLQYHQGRELSELSESDTQKHRLKEYRLGMKLRNYDSFAQVVKGIYAQLLIQQQRQQDHVAILHNLADRLRAESNRWQERYLQEIEASNSLTESFLHSMQQHHPMNQQQVDTTSSKLIKACHTFRAGVKVIFANGIKEI